MTDPIVTAKASFVKAEPVMAAHIAAAVVGYTLTLLVAHHVITNTWTSALTQQVLPAVTAVILLLMGAVVRRFVTPAAAFAERVELEVEKRLNAAPAIGAHSAF